MHFTNIALLATAASAVVLPAPLVAREGGDFDVSNFKAYRKAGSVDTIVDFDLAIPASGLAQTHCTGTKATPAKDDTATEKRMTNVSAQCADTQESFVFKKLKGGRWELELTFVNTDGRLTTGTHKFTRAEDVSGGGHTTPAYELISLRHTSFVVTGTTAAS